MEPNKYYESQNSIYIGKQKKQSNYKLNCKLIFFLYSSIYNLTY